MRNGAVVAKCLSSNGAMVHQAFPVRYRPMSLCRCEGNCVMGKAAALAFDQREPRLVPSSRAWWSAAADDTTTDGSFPSLVQRSVIAIGIGLSAAHATAASLGRAASTHPEYTSAMEISDVHTSRITRSVGTHQVTKTRKRPAGARHCRSIHRCLALLGFD